MAPDNKMCRSDHAVRAAAAAARTGCSATLAVAGWLADEPRTTSRERCVSRWRWLQTRDCWCVDCGGDRTAQAATCNDGSLCLGPRDVGREDLISAACEAKKEKTEKVERGQKKKTLEVELLPPRAANVRRRRQFRAAHKVARRSRSTGAGSGSGGATALQAEPLQIRKRDSRGRAQQASGAEPSPTHRG